VVAVVKTADAAAVNAAVDAAMMVEVHIERMIVAVVVDWAEMHWR
jgi:hypothetical protein